MLFFLSGLPPVIAFSRDGSEGGERCKAGGCSTIFLPGKGRVALSKYRMTGYIVAERGLREGNGGESPWKLGVGGRGGEKDLGKSGVSRLLGKVFGVEGSVHSLHASSMNISSTSEAPGE